MQELKKDFGAISKPTWKRNYSYFYKECMDRLMRLVMLALFTCCFMPRFLHAAPSTVVVSGQEPFVAIADMQMMILPGTSAYLERAIQDAARDGAKALVVKLSTPGGLLTSSQEMIQHIFQSPIPVLVYVSPAGGSATSAGVFITIAGHIAAMAPGTSIGAAHPVQGDGKDIEGDMRTKAEQMTIAMVKSIAENRGRNVQWAEKAVKESSSITEKEALTQSVVDIVANDVTDLLKQSAGRKVKIGNTTVPLDDLSQLPLRSIEMNYQHRILNVLANPSVAALLWLGATTGLSLELYNPGAILPGVVGIICLALALMVSQVIPLSQAGILLLAVGGLLIGLEFVVPSGILGIGGIIALVLGAIYLVDVEAAPGLVVNYYLIIPVAVLLGAFMLAIASVAVRALKRRATTGSEGLIGELGQVVDAVSSHGKIALHGELWNACTRDGLIEPGAQVRVKGIKDLILEVERIDSVKESLKN
jgi:membrane-bound serine protease (ClpP class)